MLTGLGLSRRSRRAVVVLEDATLAVTGAAVGAGLGVALALLVLPAVAFTETGRAAVPPPEVALPWPTLALLAAAVTGAIVAAAALRTLRERRPAAALLREPAR